VDRRELQLLKAQNELTRRSDDFGRQPQGLPWVQIFESHFWDLMNGAIESVLRRTLHQ